MKLKLLTTADLLLKSGLNHPALIKRLSRANAKDGIITLPNAGTFFIRKTGKGYRALQIDSENIKTEADVDQEVNVKVMEILKQQCKYVCDSCRSRVVYPMIEVATEKQRE